MFKAILMPILSYALYRYGTQFRLESEVTVSVPLESEEYLAVVELEDRRLYVLNNAPTDIHPLDKQEVLSDLAEKLQFTNRDQQIFKRQLKSGNRYLVSGYGLYYPQVGVLPVVTSVTTPER